MSEWFRLILTRWHGAACGSWRDSAGSAAWSTYLMRSARVPIHTHTHPAALKLESSACHGGRASVFSVRPVGSLKEWNNYLHRPPYPAQFRHHRPPVHRLDVKAMYPTLLRDGVFPTRLVGMSYGWSIDRLARALKSSCLVARVRIKCRESLYPHKRGDVVSFPLGSFNVALATPELSAAVERGEVEKVYEVARYESGRPFEDWGKWIIGQRRRAKEIGPAAWDSYVKSLSVALSGRLAKRSGGWVHAPGVAPPVEWGEWHRVNADTGRSELYRSLCGIVQRLDVSDTRPGTLAACYAHLTAYGRVQMNRYRAIAGATAVLAQHTDGLVVTDSGLKNLEAADCIRPGEWGHLQYEESHLALWYRTPNHFWVDGAWVAAGLHGGFVVDETGAAHEIKTINPVRRAVSPVEHPIIDRLSTVRLDEIEPGVTVGPDGWCRPPRVGPRDENPPTLPGCPEGSA